MADYFDVGAPAVLLFSTFKDVYREQSRLVANRYGYTIIVNSV